ncbi:17854_t:CDS:1 [Gigaspora margarita]|uniref:17854_t:CDS:1 n=1 Tax=Gigaspora margarita TaxID=4874 RepID=A0ABN7X557_GIGMA|nr:17854_t:CDS:1 [Gigaspora margarita]
MSNNINPEETVNVPLIYLMQLEYLAIQSIEKNHNDLLMKNDGNEELSKLPNPSEKSSNFNTISIRTKAKNPPRPPNAFILYRQAKQSEIVAANKNISNNEVSKEIGDMWHKEPLEIKMKFQVMADIAKLEHMQKYPEYKYHPRRPEEKKRRRSKKKCEFSMNEISSQQNQIQETDICSFSKTKSKTNHENHLFSEQAPPLHGEINSENNEFVNQNCDNLSLQLISNDLYSSNEIPECSQDVTSMFNSHFIYSVIN